MSNQKGPYENEKGMNIRVTDFSDGSGAKIDFYSNNPEDDHTSIHMKIDYDSKSVDIIDTTSGEKEESKSNCFLTTACMKHMKENFDDNCYELNVLRWFRDNFVSPEDINHYYILAPIIVEEINKLDSCDNIYQNIYDNVIKICIKKIQNDDYKSAYKLYKKCILELEEKYARPVLNYRLIGVLKKKRDLMYIKEICWNGEQVVKSFLDENNPKTEHVYRLVPNNPNKTEIKVSNNNIANNARFVANLFD